MHRNAVRRNIEARMRVLHRVKRNLAEIDELSLNNRYSNCDARMEMNVISMISSLSTMRQSTFNTLPKQ